MKRAQGDPGASAEPLPADKTTANREHAVATPSGTSTPADSWANSRGAQPGSGGFGNAAKLNETLAAQDFEPASSKGRDLWTRLLPVLLAFLFIASAYYFLFALPASQSVAAPAKKPADKINTNPLPGKTAPAESPGNPAPVSPEPPPSSVSPLPPYEGVPSLEETDLSVPPIIPPAPPGTNPPDPPVVPGTVSPPSFTPGAGASGAPLSPCPLVAATAPGGDPEPDPAAPPSRSVTRVEVPSEARPAADVLVKFLEAPAWKERINYTSNSPKLRSVMEKYYQQNSDGIAKAKSVVFYGDRAILDENQNLKIFMVETESVAGGIPVAVEKTKDGKFTVSWSSFAQFKDKVLDKFAVKPSAGRRGQFCATLKRSHYFGSGTTKLKKDDLLSFSLSTPIKNASVYEVVLDRKSELGQQMVSVIQYGVELPVTVDLEWITDDGAPYMKLASMPLPGWRDE